MKAFFERANNRWRRAVLITGIVSVVGLQACRPQKSEEAQRQQAMRDSAEIASCHVPIPGRLTGFTAGAKSIKPTQAQLAGMVLIPAGTFAMGANNEQGRPDEYPRHTVYVDSFRMDATEVTNAQFARFVKATGYVTTAERKPDWEQIRKQLPPGTPRPDDKLLVASSLVFTIPRQEVSLDDYTQWWNWVAGADWRHPQGPGSSIKGKENHPVVQVSWDDAMAYATWAGKRLPTEAEWEWAARGGQRDAVYPWGNEPVEAGKPKANSWQGRFPMQNTGRDGFLGTAPVMSFAPNGYGLYDMAGNVWEWCADLYRSDYYQTSHQQGIVKNPTGPTQSYDPDEPTVPKRVQRGGSFLCNDAYCSSYRSAARMKSSPDTGLSHTGFRCAL